MWFKSICRVIWQGKHTYNKLELKCTLEYYKLLWNSEDVQSLKMLSFILTPNSLPMDVGCTYKKSDDNTKECSNYCTIVFISHASKVMLKILHARLQQYMNRELSDVQAGFRKYRGTRDQIANIHWIMEKAREFQKKKHLHLLYWLCQSLRLCGSSQTVENSDLPP